MIRYIIRRLIWAVGLFLAVTLIGFVLFYLIPADPAKFACGRACTQVMVDRVAHYLGTDRPVYIQYLRFLGRLMPLRRVLTQRLQTNCLKVAWDIPDDASRPRRFIRLDLCSQLQR